MTTDILGVSRTANSLAVFAEKGSGFTDKRWVLHRAYTDAQNRLNLEFNVDSRGNMAREPKHGNACWQWSTMSDIRKIKTFNMTKPQKASYSNNAESLTITMPPVLNEYRKRAHKKSADPSQPELNMPSETRYGLRDLVRLINERKADMGDELVLSISAEGTLKAMVEYG